MRISLKLFLLLCLAACLVVCWYGMTHERALTLAWIRGNNTSSWQSFSDTGGYSGDAIGGIAFDGNGNAILAKVRDARGMVVLYDKPEVSSRLPKLSVFGREAFNKFDAERFPKLTSLSLGGLDITSETLSSIGSTPDLVELNLSEFSTNPIAAFPPLRGMTSLRKLTVRSDKFESLDDFPALEQLSMLVIDCAKASTADIRRLEERLPNCVVSVNVEPYHQSMVDTDSAN